MIQETPNDPHRIAMQELTEAVRGALRASELLRDDMILTDIVVITAQRGVYDASTGTSLVTTMEPTDTPQFVVHGLLDMAKIEANCRAERVYALNDDEDEE